MPTPADAGAASEQFLHVRVVIGVILGLSIGKLLQGLANMAEHPRRTAIWWVHLGWVLWALLSVIGFWWWEYGLAQVQVWTFGTYLFIFAYAACYFMICALLFPDDLSEWPGFEQYFLSRRKWFFGIIALTTVMDVADTQLKGAAYSAGLGLPYQVQIGALLLICAVGAMTGSRRVQAAILIAALIGRLLFFFTFYDRLG